MINVAIIGYGAVAKIMHAPLISATEGLRLHTVVSSNPAKVAADWPEARVVATLDEALADHEVQLVVIATPDPLHAPMAIAALKAGKSVVVDKPFAVELSDARDVVEQAKVSPGLLSVFQNRRWDGDFLTLRRLMDEGRLGEVVQYESYFNRYRPLATGTWKEAREGGLWLDLGPHVVDQALTLFGEPIAIFTDIAAQKPQGPGGDYVRALLRYPRLRVVLGAAQMTVDSRLRLAVHGEKGSWVKDGWDTQENQLKAGARPGDQGFGLEEAPGQFTPAADGVAGAQVTVVGEAGNYSAYYAAIRDAIQGRGPNPVTPDQAILTMRVLEAGKRSAAERREVLLSEV
ncbi:MAG: oxidoreductase domain protein [Caulobacteraceae bacterium]|nr:oxidoreductase domain protein [Caulobacteraceae bacterium]